MSRSPATSPIDKIEHQLAKILAASQPKNKNVVRREKNGDVTYETVRAVPHGPACAPRSANSYTETPASAQNGQQFGSAGHPDSAVSDQAAQPEVAALEQLAAPDPTDWPPAGGPSSTGISIHDAHDSGQQIVASDSESADPLEELLSRALSKPKRGRPAVFDEHNKGKLVALLSLGMSLRQAASVLGVSHGTVRNTLKADTALAEEITAARFQAQLQPLACVIREARRSWKAATWLLKYLDNKIASHEETPEERNQRQQQEIEEFHARARRRM